MIMSNFISESERHAELYGTYTYEQSSALEIVQENIAHKNSYKPILNLLHEHNVGEEEIHWLERTGRITKTISAR